MAAEKIEQDSDAFARGVNMGHDSGESVECAAGDLNFFAGLKGSRNDMQLFRTDGLLELCDGGVWNLRGALAEADDFADAGGVMDEAKGLVPIEAGKKVAGKKHFVHPYGAADAGFLEADAREEDVDAGLAQVSGSDVLVLGLSLDAEP